MHVPKHQNTWAQQWLLAQPNPRDILLGTQLVEARPAGEGRGLGLFAARQIPAYSQILSEAPLVLMRPTDDLPQLWQQYEKLSPQHRESYDKLSFPPTPQKDTLLAQKLRERRLARDESGNEVYDDMIRVANIMQTNAFNVDMADGAGPRHRALFPTVARINHSCMPNAHVCFYDPGAANCEDGKGRMVIHSLCEIQPGTEISISYFNLLMPRSARKDRAITWSFECGCAACMDSAAPSEGVRLSATQFLSTYKSALVHPAQDTKRLEATIQDGRRLVAQCLEFDFLRPSLPDIWDAIAMLYVGLAMKLLSRGQSVGNTETVDALERSVLAEASITGPKSPSTKRRLKKLLDFSEREGLEPVVTSKVDGQLLVSWQKSV